jgi:hypothetical protein
MSKETKKEDMPVEEIALDKKDLAILHLLQKKCTHNSKRNK